MSLGALTTTFTPPATCVQSFSNLYINHTRDLTGPAIAGPLSANDCFPDNFDLNAADRYYSPGVCPVGYTAACSSSNTISSTRTETVVTCCPSLMACASPRYDWESTLPCTRVLRGLDQTTSVTYLDPKNGRPTMIEPWTPLWYYGLGIQIRLQAADPDPDPRPAPTETGSGPSNSPGGGSQGLSAGAAAGIAIGVVLLLLLVIGGAIGACLLKRRARKRQQAQVSPPPTSSAPYETDGQGLPASAVYKTEIAGHQRPAELYPLHHEAAYGSQVHLASQELEQPTKIYEAVNVPYAWPPPPQPQAYEMSPQAGSWTPPPPVYEMSSLSRRTRGG